MQQKIKQILNQSVNSESFENYLILLSWLNNEQKSGCLTKAIASPFKFPVYFLQPFLA